MEYTSTVKFTTWEGGYEWEYIGRVKRLDPLSKTIYLEVNNEEKYTMKIKFDDIVRIEL